MDPSPQTPVTSAPLALPAVVVVMITHDPGDWFEQVLEGIADQEYGDLSVLVIDTNSQVDPTPRIAAALPTAFVRRLDDDPGYGPAANLALSMIEGAAFFLFCHDDVHLRPGAVRAMVEEAFRSNASIVAPKMLSWNEPERILSVGMTTDKFGVPAAYVERGELDQEQHDAVRDVLLAPGGCTLVRADLFRELEGFDEGIPFLGEALALSWRAHLAGGRVLVAPAAEVLHLEALGERRADEGSRSDGRRRQQARHRLRNVLSNYGRWHLVRILPQHLVLSLIEAAYAVLAGRMSQAREILGAYSWNLRRLDEIRLNRQLARRIRRVPDREIRAMQVRGSARFSAFLRGQIGRGDDRVARAGARVVRGWRTMAGRSRRLIVIGFALLAAVFLLGTRGLVDNGIPDYGEFASFPRDPWLLLREFFSDWQGSGVGSPGAPPTAFGVLGVLGLGAFGNMGALRAIMIVGLFPLGAFGTWRAARRIGLRQVGSMVATAAFLALPLPYNALAEGSWSGLAVWAATPFILIRLVDGYRSRGIDGTPEQPWLSISISLGLLIWLLSTFVPIALVLVPIVVLAVVVGGTLVGETAGSGRVLAIGAVASAIAFVLQLPWLIGLLTGGFTWASVAGTRSGGDQSALELVRFATGPHGAGPLGYALPLAALVPLLVGRSWRLIWASRLLMVAVLGWLLAVAGEVGALDFALPRPEVLLAPGAAAVALSIGLGVASFEEDLEDVRFGWRQLAVGLGALLTVAGVAPWLGWSLQGRWDSPEPAVSARLALFDRSAGGWARTMWVGPPDSLPVAGWRLDEDLTWGLVDVGRPTVRDRFVDEDPATTTVGRSLDVALRGDTQRLGRLLLPSGVRYVVVPLLDARGSEIDPDLLRPVLAGLDEQLDLERVVGISGALAVYDNTAWVPVVASVPAGSTPAGSDFDAALAYPTDDTEPILARDQPAGTRRYEERTVAPKDVVVGMGGDGWRLDADAAEISGERAFGWARRYPVAGTGDAELTLSRPLSGLRILAVVGQVLALAFVAIWGWAARRGART